MKSDNRTRLICFKTLPCGVREKFGVVVMTQNVAAAEKRYSSEGYLIWQEVMEHAESSIKRRTKCKE